jgi:hypothetical protein
MAFSYGRQFRRTAAQALTADPGEMRALIARILPAREAGAAPALRLETEADYKIAPAAIVFAFFADVLSGDEAADLLRKTEDPVLRKQLLPKPRAAQDPLADFIRRCAEDTEKYQARVAEMFARWQPESAAAHCSAANEAGELVKNNENTSEACCHAADQAPPERPP